MEVAQTNDLEEVLKLYHDSRAHPGINTTIKSIRQKCFFPASNKDVTI